jgi:hypothetical protein
LGEYAHHSRFQAAYREVCEGMGSKRSEEQAGRGHTIELVGEADLHDLLALMRGYCDFYKVDPEDHALLELSRALIADPDREGL